MKKINDIVADATLCQEAADIIGNETALVRVTGIVSKRCKGCGTELCGRHCYPAPTLAELLEMLPHDVHISKNVSVGLKCQKTRDGRYWLTYRTSVKDNSNVPDAEFDINAATAALRLLMKVKSNGGKP